MAAVGARPDPRGYVLQQQALERRIRAAKRDHVLSLDVARARKAGKRVSEAQAGLRAYLAAYPELKRQRGRKSVTHAVYSCWSERKA